MSVTLVKPPVASAFAHILTQVKNDLLLVSPYIGAEPLRAVDDAVRSKKLNLSLLLSASAANALSGSVDLVAVAKLMESTGQACFHLPRLHAKAYIADETCALITSANLTYSGLNRNEEYGVLLENAEDVRQVRIHFEGLRTVAVPLELDRLQTLAELARSEGAFFRQAERDATTAFRQLVKNSTEAYDESVRQARSRTGSTHNLFGQAILQILRESGPLATKELHPFIQDLMPDLCDDRLDRVINGVHFGKKWKHHVRNAQQHLKARGLIALDASGRWCLLEGENQVL